MSSGKVELYAIRHAQSHMNTLPIFSGRSNETPLTELGIEQAKALGDHFVSQGVTPSVVYVSPAVRTLQTAQHCLGQMGLNIEPLVHEALQELDQGSWVGQKRDSVLTAATYAQMRRLGKDFKEGGGESANEVALRLMGWINETFDECNTHKIVFMFSHGAAITCLASHLQDWSYQDTWEIRPPNASASLLTSDGKNWRLEYFGAAPEHQPTAT